MSKLLIHNNLNSGNSYESSTSNDIVRLYNNKYIHKLYIGITGYATAVISTVIEQKHAANSHMINLTACPLFLPCNNLKHSKSFGVFSFVLV